MGQPRGPSGSGALRASPAEAELLQLGCKAITPIFGKVTTHRQRDSRDWFCAAATS